MTTIAPPYYDFLAIRIGKSSLDQTTKDELVTYINGYKLGESVSLDEEKKRRLNAIIKEVLDKEVSASLRKCAVLLGKIERSEALNEEEKLLYQDFTELLFDWDLSAMWFYNLVPGAE